MKTSQIRPNQPLAFAGTGSVFLFALLAVFLPVRFAAAQSGTWLADPNSGDWNTGGNWVGGASPNAAADTAIFKTSSQTTVSISADTEVNSIVFNAGASAFTITASAGTTLTLSGAGIVNQSGVTQNFLNPVSGPGGDESGLLVFSGTADAGSLVSIVDAGGVTSGAVGGATIFEGNSSAGSATLASEGGSNGGRGGGIYFTGAADGGTASAIANGNGFLDLSGLTDGGMNIGSIEGSGTFYLGANTLTVGGNNRSTTVSGVIADGGADGGIGGALVKSGTGTLTLAGDNTFTGNTTVNAGALDITGTLGGADLYVGYSGTGSLTQTGAASVISNEQLTLGNNAGSKGVYTLSSGSAITIGDSYIGYGGVGSFSQTSGTYVTAINQYLGYNTGAAGSYDLAGGLLEIYALNIYVGYNGSGTFTQSGGTNIIDEAFLYYVGIPFEAIQAPDAGLAIGYNQGSSGEYLLTGGSLTALNYFVGYSGTGVFIQTGGAATANSVGIGDNAGSSGVYDLNGGTLKASVVGGGAGTSVFNFNGGILQAATQSDYLIRGLTTANVQAGGAIVDTDGFDVTIPQALLHDTTLGAPVIDGGLTKIGLGTLSLTGSNTYTGPTLVNAGTLALLDLGSLGATAVTVGSTGTDATLQITGSNATIGSTGVGSVTLAPDTGTLSLQDGEFNSLFIHGAGSSPGLVLGGSDDIDIDVSGTNADSIFLDPTRKASVTGTNFIIPTYLSLASGTDVLITAPGGGLATGGVFVLGGPRYVGVQSILNTGTTVVLASDFNPVPITAYFTGEFGSTWDTISGSGTSGLVNFSSDSAGTDNTGQLPFQITNVLFSAASAASGNLSTTLGQDFSINSLTMDGTSAAGAGQPVSISGNTLTILGTGGLGIVMDPGAGPLTINSSLVITGTQTWVNNSSSLLTISGSSISAANPLTIAGSGNTLLTSPFISSFPDSTYDFFGVYGLIMAGTGELTLGGDYPNLEADNNTVVTSGTLAITGNVNLGNLLVDGTGRISPVALLGPGATLNSGTVFIGAEGAGIFNQTGGDSNADLGDAVIYLGDGPGGTGIYNLSGGTLNFNVAVGGSGAGIFTQTGGAITGELALGGLVYGITFGIGENSAGVPAEIGGSGVYNLVAGSAEFNKVLLGVSGSGSFIQTGGTNTETSEPVILGVFHGSTGVYTLSGGTLDPYEVTGGSGTSIFNFNGGIIQASFSTTSFMSGLTTANVQAGGAIIDSNSDAITISQSLVHDTTPGAPAIDGGLTKIGQGTLTLSGTNSYTGATTVDAGTLELAKENSLYDDDTASWTADNIVVRSGATLALLVGGPGDFTAADIAKLTPLGSGTGGFQSGSYIGIDTTDGSLTYSTPITDPNGGANALGLVKLGPNTLTLSGDSTYTGNTLVTGGTLAITGAVVSATAAIIVDGSAPDAPAATLAASGSLNTEIAIVGQNGLGSFTQSGGVNTNIALELGGNQGSSGIYTLGGGSFTTQFLYVGLSGSGSFTQTGGTSSFGIVYLGDAAGGTGAFTLGAGSLQSFFLDIGATTGGTGVFLQTGGTAATTDAVYIGQAGSYTLSGGELSTTAVTGGTGASVFNFNGGTLQASGSNSAFISGLAAAYVRAGGAIIDTNGYNITISQPLLHDPYDTAAGTQDADGGLKKIGLGTLTLTGSSNYAGGTLINAGTLQTENAHALGTGDVTLNAGTLAPQGALDVRSFNWNGGAIDLTLGTDSDILNVGGFFTAGHDGGTFSFTAGTGFALNTVYTLITTASEETFYSDTFNGNSLDGVTPIFTYPGGGFDVEFVENIPRNLTWVANPASGDWNTAANWVSGGPPDSGTDTAIFKTSSVTSVSISQSTQVNGIVFDSGASQYTITAGPGYQLYISGTGINNQSGTVQNFATAVDGAGHTGEILFGNNATAGIDTAYGNAAGEASGLSGGEIQFEDNSSAGSGVFTNHGGVGLGGETGFFDNATAASGSFVNIGSSVNGGYGGETQLGGNATAGNGTFISTSGSVAGANGGITQFFGNATGGNGSFINYGAAISSTGALAVSSTGEGTTTFNQSATAGAGAFTNYGGTAVGGFGGGTVFYETTSASNGVFTSESGEASMAYGGLTEFWDSATAANGHFINYGGDVSGALGGQTDFEDGASAANGIFTGYGATVSSTGGGGGSIIGFSGSSSAGNGTFTAYGGTVNGAGGADIQFHDMSTAASGTFTINGGTGDGANGAYMEFDDTSTAASGTFTVNGASVAGAGGGSLYFTGSSTAGGGTFTVSASTASEGGGGAVSFENISTAGNSRFTLEGGSIAGETAAGIAFFNSATAGNGRFTLEGGAGSLTTGAVISFEDSSTSGSGTFIINGGQVAAAYGAGVQFTGTSSAGDAVFTVNNGVNFGGRLLFGGESTGGTATVDVFGNGYLDISGHDADGVEIGSIAGAGQVFLGANRLTVGNNNVGTTFSGVIADGGNDGGTGGSLIKTGTGTLTLAGANTYTGSTSVNAGLLDLANTLALQDSTLVTGGIVFDSSVTSDAFTLGGLSGTGAIVLRNNAGAPAPVTVSVGNDNANTSFSGRLGGGGSLEKIGAGTLTLSSSNSYAGGTIINGGALQTTNENALGAGPATLNVSGTLAPAGRLDLASLTWNAGTLAMSLGTDSSFLQISGSLSDGGSGGKFAFATGSGFNLGATYALATVDGGDDFLLGDFSGNLVDGDEPLFSFNGDTIDVRFVAPPPQNLTWLANPSSSDWNTAGNWISGGPPNSPSETAIFATSSTTAVSISQNTDVNSIQFDPGASSFTITASQGETLTISGTGILNSSGTTENFVAAGTVTGTIGSGGLVFTNGASAGTDTTYTTDGGTAGGVAGSTLMFTGSSTAGYAVITNNRSATTGTGSEAGSTVFTDNSTAGSSTIVNNASSVSGIFGGGTYFKDNSTAGSSTITVNGASVSPGVGGILEFTGTSSAGGATLIANAGSNTGDYGGGIFFYGASTGGTAAAVINGGNGRAGVLDISYLTTPGMSIGSIAGQGLFELGSKTLTVGGNNQSTVVNYGEIEDGGGNGGTGGALVKVGTGTLTIDEATYNTGGDDYSGGTTIDGGTFETAVYNTVGNGGVTLNTGGNLAPLGSGPLTVDGTFNWNGGTVTMALGTQYNTGLLDIQGNLIDGGAGGKFDFTAGAGFSFNFPYAIATAANVDGFVLNDFTGTTLDGVAPTFFLSGTTVEVEYINNIPQNLTWRAAPASQDWSTEGNWVAGGPPDTAAETAIFKTSSITDVTFAQTTVIGSILFDAGASSYSFNPGFAGLGGSYNNTLGGGNLTISGTGIVNLSGTTQYFAVGNSNGLSFINGATAGDQTVFTTIGAPSVGEPSTSIAFSGSSNAGGGTFNNPGGGVNTDENDGVGGQTNFSGDSSAAQGTFNNDGASSISGAVGQTNFSGTSSAGHGVFNNLAGATVLTDGGQTNFSGSSSAASGVFNNAGGSALVGYGGQTNFSGNATAGAGTFTNGAGSAALSYGGETVFSGSSTAANGMFVNEGASVTGSESLAAPGGGETIFADTSTGGSGTFTNDGGLAGGVGGGQTVFEDNSTAGNGDYTQNGGAAGGAYGGQIIFTGTSTAGAATLAANGSGVGGSGGGIYFRQQASGGTAAVTATGNGFLDISALSTGGMTLGSIAGSGNFFLGGKTLTVGGNNASTTVSGLIEDSGTAGGIGGALTKVGAGTLTLTASNGYSGGTTINGGTLQTENASGAGTGGLALNAGAALAPEGRLNLASFTWNGGTLDMSLGTASSFLDISGDAVNGGAAGTFDFSAGSGFALNTVYALGSAGGAENFSSFSQEILSGNELDGVDPTFSLNGTTLDVEFIKAIAQNFTWQAHPASGDWNTGGNWVGGTSPNGGADSAIFKTSSQTNVSLSADTEVNSIVFNAGASAFTITTGSGLADYVLTISGTGIINNSGVTENFNAEDSGSAAHSFNFTNRATAGQNTVFTNEGGFNHAGMFTYGETNFADNSSAGSASFINNGGGGTSDAYPASGGETNFSGSSTASSGTFTDNAGTISFALGGETNFSESASAGNGVFTNNGATVSSYGFGGGVNFSGTSTAANSIITNNGATVSGSLSLGGGTIFNGDSTAGNATLIANGSAVGGEGGTVYFEGQSDGGTANLTANGNGYLDISGLTTAGMNIGSIAGSGDFFLGSKTLTVGGNNLSTTVSGMIQDGGGFGGTGGAIIKTGTGTLTFSGSNTYSGGTTIKGGTLLTSNASALGTGAATLDSGAVLAPEGRLTLKSLTWNGGTISMSLGTDASNLQIGGNLTDGGAGGDFDFTAGSGFALNTTYTLAAVTGSDDFSLNDFSGNALDGADPTFALSGSDVDVEFIRSTATEIGGVTGTPGDGSIITGGTTAVSVIVADNGANPMDATVTGSAGVTGSATLEVAAGSSGTTDRLVYTGTSVGADQHGSYIVSATNASNSPVTGSVTVNVYGHADPLLSGSGALDLGFAHVGYASALTSANSITVTNGTSGDYIVDLSGTAAAAGNISLTGMTGIAAGGSAPITATLAAGQGVGTIDSTLSYVFSDDSTLSGASANVDTVNLTVTGEVYSGKSTWASAGGGSWGTLASGFGSNWGANQGSPGLDPDFTATDTATFGGAVTSGTAIIALDGAAPSLAAITFNDPNAGYQIVGSGLATASLGAQALGTTGIILNGGTANALLADMAGNDEISVPLTLNTNAAATVTRAADILTLSGPLSGPGGLIISGAGTLLLGGSNSYTGGTMIDSGIVQLGNANGLGASGSFLAINGGKLDLHGYSITLGLLSGSGGGVITNNDGHTAVTLTVNSSANTIYGGMIEDGAGKIGLTKQGSGVLLLAGASTYTGDTTIDGGLLEVNGSISSTNTTINSGGMLGGVGTIGGNVINGGVVAPGDAPGTLTINGNYTQSPAGTLVIQIAGLAAGQHDLLAIGGSASLDGALQLVRLDNFQISAGEKLEFLTAAGGVTGKFSKVETGTIVGGEIIYQPKDVLLEFTQGSFVSLGAPGSPYFTGLTPNQKAVAADLDTVLTDSRARSLIKYLDNQSLDNLPADFDLIAPEELTALYNISFAAADVHQGNLDGRMAAIRAGSRGFASSLSVSDSHGAVELGNDGKASLAPAGKDLFQPTPDNPWGVFISGNGDFVNLAGDYNAQGYDFTTGGVTIGIDYRLGECLAIGVALDYAHTWTNLDNGGAIDANSGRAGVYATLYNGGLYLNAYAGGGYNSYYTQRAALSGNATGNTDGGEFDSFLSGGYDLHSGPWTFGPTGAVAFTNVGISPYTESGSLAPLKIVSQNQDSVTTDLGWELSFAGRVKGVLITPHLSASWEHQYAFDALPFDARFASGAGAIFTVHGPGQGRDSASVEAGVSVQWNANLSFSLDYDGVLNGSYQSNDITGGLNISF